jgi:hypothetical protein
VRALAGEQARTVLQLPENTVALCLPRNRLADDRGPSDPVVVGVQLGDHGTDLVNGVEVGVAVVEVQTRPTQRLPLPAPPLDPAALAAARARLGLALPVGGARLADTDLADAALQPLGSLAIPAAGHDDPTRASADQNAGQPLDLRRPHWPPGRQHVGFSLQRGGKTPPLRQRRRGLIDRRMDDSAVKARPPAPRRG